MPTDLGDLQSGFDFGGLTGKQTINGVIDINDLGQVAFANFYQNGTIGVYVATPTIILGCNPSDLAEPCGQLDFSDVVAFLGAFAAMDPVADFALPFGTFDFSDIFSFLASFGGGCP